MMEDFFFNMLLITPYFSQEFFKILMW